MKPEHFKQLLEDELNDIKKLLLFKNERYGNSALEPLRVFSKDSPLAQLEVRIDDKLSRIANQSAGEDEDAVLDLIGYLLIYRLAKKARA